MGKAPALSEGALTRSSADPSSADGPTLAPMRTPGTTFRAFRAYALDAAAQPQAVATPDERRDALLADYRRAFTRQMLHDLDYTRQALGRRARDGAALSDARIAAGLDRLSDLRTFLSSHDGWSSNRFEGRCWRAVQQYYCDALALGHRLLSLESGDCRSRRRPGRRRRLGESAEADGFQQALVNLLEQIFPGFRRLSPLRGVLPAALYTVSRSVMPWLPYRWHRAADHLRRLLTCGALSGYGRANPLVRFEGRRHLLEHSGLFASASGRTRHNVVLVFSHRHSVLDMPILCQALHGLDYAMWVNRLYFPRSAAEDPALVAVQAGDAGALDRALQRSAELLGPGGVPLVICVDGGAPYLMYGQQMRIKRGIRLLVDHLAEVGRRETFIVPITLEDTAALVRGLDPGVTVTFHAPFRADQAAPAPGDPQQVNHGDPLLNHLEAFFLGHTAQ